MNCALDARKVENVNARARKKSLQPDLSRGRKAVLQWPQPITCGRATVIRRFLHFALRIAP